MAVLSRLGLLRANLHCYLLTWLLSHDNQFYSFFFIQGTGEVERNINSGFGKALVWSGQTTTVRMLKQNNDFLNIPHAYEKIALFNELE